jgi:hypothetical protein
MKTTHYFDEFKFFAILPCIEGIQLEVPGADIDHTAYYCRRGGDPVPSGSGPESGTAAGIEGIQLAVIRTDIDHTTRDCSLGVDATASGSSPESGTAAGIEGIQLAVIRTDIDHTTRDCSLGVDATASGSSPESGTAAGIEGIQLVVMGADIDYPFATEGEESMKLSVGAVQRVEPLLALKAYSLPSSEPT